MKINFDFAYFLSRFGVIGRYLPLTLTLAFSAFIIGLLIGTGLTLLRKLENKILNRFINLYVSYFRGTPLLVQLFIFFYGLPQIFPQFGKITAIYASVLVMSINASAYMSEVIRSAIDAVDKGQMDAALSVGMTKKQAMIRIILPQAARIAIPPLGNTMISLIQGTAITFTLGVKEMMGQAKVSAAASFRFLENYLAVGLIYWAITLILSYYNKSLEKEMNKGFR